MSTEFDGPEGEKTLAAARAVFGERFGLAERYWSSLAGAGVERGLIGPREVDRLWIRHVLNCAVIGDLMSDGENVVDVGSGAGLPGLAVAIAKPTVRMTLVEPLLRRATFLEEVVAELELDVRVVRGRAEEKTVKKIVGGADVVTSRAVAPLDRLAKWCVPLLRPGGRLVAVKGSSAADEIEQHLGTLGRIGLSNVHVETTGAGILERPTTVVVATRIGGRR
ncbi:16S rRNA (guanine(527)-N(7))-methyltransferase RsmG [Williamsia sp.]|uniref:16S rRNA (guanine(527)-N(7))-methyltransferase RsmG n=1 Tax=Williamsia sp. TaxID=1872085 RepID=UPI002F9552C5